MPTAELRATTVVAVRHNGLTALGGDGQVTLGDTVIKGTATKVRSLRDGKILTGFAGAVADAFTLFEKLEEKLERYPANLRYPRELRDDPERLKRVLVATPAGPQIPLALIADIQGTFTTQLGAANAPDLGAFAGQLKPIEHVLSEKLASRG